MAAIKGLLAMTAAAEKTNETLAFKADVAKLLHMMVHSVYSDRDVFLRELISNAADACERLRYEAIATLACLPTTRRSGSPWRSMRIIAASP
jgi:molecular chaperone HtpG